MPPHPADVAWRFRQDPDCVVLGVKPGVVASGKQPVRIFLGTEDAQYRAERVFFYSIEKHRDSARVYEIYLMKNLIGFARKAWRTGFTNYRFAIPELAGFTGRAIYNDVDQIYLTDPALLFDEPMNGHGYLAISAKDTSVMLIDCVRMKDIWNRGTASTWKKGRLTNQPAETPGLWGAVDRGWNARDVEYAEGASKVLHYTALHQQPWSPFPGVFSYHPNPLAYLWHELEREADAAGYQPFCRTAPSAAYAPAMDDAPSGTACSPPSPRAVEMMAMAPPATVLHLTVGAPASGSELTSQLGGAAITTIDLAGPAGNWPEARFDGVLISGGLDLVPSEDLPWLLDEAFSHAGTWLYIAAPADTASFSASDGGDAHCGRRTSEWWRDRVAEAAGRAPGISWHLDVAAEPARAPIAAFQTRTVASDATPRVWALIDDRDEVTAQVTALATALGWPFERKRLVYNALHVCPNVALGASLASLDHKASSPLAAPWPDLVLAWGRRSVPAARWIREQSGGQTRLVQLGRPRAPFTAFDLIVTTAQYDLPMRANVQHLVAPLAAVDDQALDAVRADLEPRLDNLPHPRIGIIVQGEQRRRFDAAAAVALARRAREVMNGGSLLIGIGEDDDGALAEAVQAAAGGPCQVVGGGAAEQRMTVLALADQVLVAADDAMILAEVCASGRPATIFEATGGSALDGLKAHLPKGLRGTYRGTPFQQTFVGRFVDGLVERGVLAGSRSANGVRRALEARGLACSLDADGPISSPHPLADLDDAVRRIRRLMREHSFAA